MKKLKRKFKDLHFEDGRKRKPLITSGMVKSVYANKFCLNVNMESPFNIDELEKASKEVFELVRPAQIKMKTKVKLKNNVQKYRIWKNLQQKELAKKIYISVSELALIEKQKIKRPRLDLRLRICEFFGVSHDQMFYEDDEIFS